MTLEIDGKTYYTAVEVTNHLAISRQTLWRWRSEGKVPHGHRFRDKQIIFTESEFKGIKEFANRIELLSVPSPQLSLFSRNRSDLADE